MGNECPAGAACRGPAPADGQKKRPSEESLRLAIEPVNFLFSSFWPVDEEGSDKS